MSLFGSCHQYINSMAEKCFAIGDCLYSRQHFFSHGVFDQVTRGSVFQHLPYYTVFIMRSQRQDLELRETVFEFRAEVYPADIRQAYVEEHHIGFPETNGVATFGGTVCYTSHLRYT